MGTVGRGALAAVACSVLLVAGAAARPGPRRAPAVELATAERQVHAAVNRHRLARGLPPLVADAHLAGEARRHSRAMATGVRTFGHAGFDRRVASVRRAARCATVGENVARQQGYADVATAAMSGWLDSPGHRRNIEGRFTLTGVAVVSDGAGLLYVTQIFCGA